MSPEVTAAMRLAMFVVTLGAALYWGWRKGNIDWMGVAVLCTGIALAATVGVGSSRELEGILRMPSTLLVCAYVLMRQPR